MEPLEASRRIYDLLADAGRRPAPRMRAWNGDTWGPEDAPGTIVLNHPHSLRALLMPASDLAAGEAYLHGDVDLEGDMVGLMRFAADLKDVSLTRRLRVLDLARRLPPPPRDRRSGAPRISGLLHSRRRDRQAVTYHYDTGNDFFTQFLDPAMVYSCAYFLDPDEDLATAQRRKLDLICRKLGLAEGQSFLDIGCGWGALVIHAAERYGARATGITLSGEQAEWARDRAKRAGVDDRVTILVADYREMSGRFDAIASVGMVEHVGRSRLDEYFTRLRRMLAPGGQLLNHGIVTNDRRRRRRRSGFVSTYVFPDGELTPVEVGIRAAERAGFELRDAENLRASYALTLERWVANLEANAEAARRAGGERNYRIWRAYMAGSVVAFEQAAIAVFQLLLSDPARPWAFGRRRLLAADD